MEPAVKFLPTLPSLLVSPGAPFIHRDLSWLQFNDRVLAEANKATNPLFERMKFLAISSSNLDEFFMVRFASLQREISASARATSGDRRKIRGQLRIRSSVLEHVARFGAKQTETLDLLTAELESQGIFIVRQASPEHPAHGIGKRVFDAEILPKLPAPEPFGLRKLAQLENLQMAAIFGGNQWVQIPRSLPPVFMAIGPREGEVSFFFLDDLIENYLGTTLGTQGKPGLIRMTRDGDITVDLEEEDTESIPDIVRSSLGARERGGPVRFQYGGDLAPDLLNQMHSYLRLHPGQVFPAPYTFCLQGLWAVLNQTPEEIAAKPGLRYPPRRSAGKHRIVFDPANPGAVFERIRRGDFLLHHPYDSFDSYVAWIQAAAADPAVESIEQTVYRMDALSPVIEALKQAAPRKKVRVFIELRARFDELSNLRLAEELRKAGVEVSFGFGRLKLHAKIALVTRREEGGERRYVHLSTGNYNAATARLYTDLAILTANPEMGADAVKFLESIRKGEVPGAFKHLVIAPTRLHRLLSSLIEQETEAAKAGKKARIVAKVNALVDKGLIEKLYAASQAGVQVDLVVRGACSLIPGVKGLSERIRVISIVDRYLEHSRLYWFASSGRSYLSSADWMPRNFFSRLEIAFPVLDPKLAGFLEEVVIPIYLGDNARARELTPQGTWKARVRAGSKMLRSQFEFDAIAARDYAGTRLEES